MRDCDKCVWATRSGSCSSWNCDFINQAEAAEAWREKQETKKMDTSEEGEVGA